MLPASIFVLKKSIFGRCFNTNQAKIIEIKNVKAARMPRPTGRPFKYMTILITLADQGIYSPGSIANHAEQMGLLELFIEPDMDPDKIKKRIRTAMTRLRDRRQFPILGDGHVIITGQSPVPGWYGWRWKEILSGQRFGQKP